MDNDSDRHKHQSTRIDAVSHQYSHQQLDGYRYFHPDFITHARPPALRDFDV